MKTRGAMFAERKEYINKLTDILSAFPNFGEIKYARTIFSGSPASLT